MKSRVYIFCVMMLCLTSCSDKLYFGDAGGMEACTPKDRRVDFSGADAKTIPDLSKNRKLLFLNLAGNPGLDWAQLGDQIAGENLEVLILDSNSLTQLPEWVGKLNGLKYISLVNNPKLDLKQACSVLKNNPELRRLNLANNQLTEIPQEVAQLEGLMTLVLSNNALKGKQLFPNLSALGRLTWLWLDNNELGTVDSSIAQVQSLRFLYLESNGLTTLPASMGRMKKLWTLYLNENQFDTLPLRLLDISSLRFAVASRNPIRYIPEPFGKSSKYLMNAIVLDNIQLGEAEEQKAREYFGGFMLFSMKKE